MLRNYLKVISRIIYKNKLFTTINILGLAMGYTAFMLVIIFLHFETSFEHFHTKANRIFRPIYSYDSGNDYNVQWARIPVSYINELPNEFPEIEQLIRFQNREQKYIRVNKDKFRPDFAYHTDNEVFEVFDIPMIAGDPKVALKEPYSVVLTESLARKYFGSTDVLGEDLFVLSDWNPEETRYKVTGIIQDTPSNTHLPIEILFSFRNQEERSGWAYVYILLSENAQIENLAAKMSDFITKYADETSASKVGFEYQALKDIHLHSDLAREIIPNGSIEYVYIFAVVGIFILLVALINFTNLQSAMVIGRTKESGLRKILGAKTSQIIQYLIIESITYHLAALLLAIISSFLIFPYFKTLTEIDFMINTLAFAVSIVILAIISGLLTGIYPAWTLNKFSPIQSIKTSQVVSVGRKFGSINLKRMLITLQYIIAVLLIGSALIARDQFQFLNKSNLGITREQVLAIPGVPDKVKDDYQRFKDQIKTLPNIKGVTACMEVPSREIRDAGPVLISGMNNDTKSAPMMDIQVIDPNYLDVLGIELLAGETIPLSLENEPIPEFTEKYTYIDYLSEKRQVYLINETAMKKLGWQSPDEALGQQISWSIGDIKLAPGPISGIVKDYHQETLKNTIDPTIMVYEPVWLRTFLIKLNTDHIQETIAGIQTTWDNLFPNYPFEYHFLDELYNDLYKNDRVKLELLYLLCSQAIVISFIGLFGLIAFSLKTRIKEIALRKVLGADLVTLITLISKEYLLILIIAVIIGIPISYYFIDHWLQQFAYRADISMINYGITILFMVLLILFTVGFQTIKTSLINPAETLREE